MFCSVLFCFESLGAAALGDVVLLTGTILSLLSDLPDLPCVLGAVPSLFPRASCFSASLSVYLSSNTSLF